MQIIVDEYVSVEVSDEDAKEIESLMKEGKSLMQKIDALEQETAEIDVENFLDEPKKAAKCCVRNMYRGELFDIVKEIAIMQNKYRDMYTNNEIPNVFFIKPIYYQEEKGLKKEERI